MFVFVSVWIFDSFFVQLSLGYFRFWVSLVFGFLILSAAFRAVVSVRCGNHGQVSCRFLMFVDLFMRICLWAICKHGFWECLSSLVRD